jgi:mannose-6-phosphate isomerase-like protein (cupin superfamily)
MGRAALCPQPRQDGIFKPFRIPGFEARDTTINENTKGVASVMVARPNGPRLTPVWTRHEGDILFNFVMSGTMVLEGEGKEPYRLEKGDAFVIPPRMATRYSEPSDDLQLLEVSLPGSFETQVVDEI